MKKLIMLGIEGTVLALAWAAWMRTGSRVVAGVMAATLALLACCVEV